MNDCFAVIMAGGSGTRFWPRSRKRMPKQLLPIGPDRTLIQTTLDRVPPSISRERTLIVTNIEQRDAVMEQVDLPPENVIGEPEGRDTAACVGVAAALCRHRSPDSAMIVMAADHIIRPPEAFHDCLAAAVAAAREHDALVTIGIKPRFAATGYGYVEIAHELRAGLHEVLTFTEKPNAEKAWEFFASETHLWNSGIFIWKASVVLEEIARCMPTLADGIKSLDLDDDRFAASLKRVYPTLEKKSIDRGVMEKARRRLCVKATFEWDDVGSHAALARHNPKDEKNNTVLGEAILEGSEGCIIDNRADGLVAALGVDDLIIIRTQDAVLVTRRGQEEKVKAIVERLRAEGRDRYL